MDVTEGTRGLHRIALARALPLLGRKRLDEITVADINELVTSLHTAGSRRETIRKTVKYTAAVLEDAGVVDNPARGRRVRLPHEEPAELEPPDSATVEAVAWLLPTPSRLALLWPDWSGARVASVDLTLVGDYDEPRRRVRLRAAATKTRRGLWVDLPDVLANAVEATLPPREDSDPQARLFPGVTGDRLRNSIGRACRAAAVPAFSPHDLRHRRISLLHRQGRTWAEIGQLVGQRQLSVTADVYTHVLSDGREVDYAAILVK